MEYKGQNDNITYTNYVYNLHIFRFYLILQIVRSLKSFFLKLPILKKFHRHIKNEPRKENGSF